jgi:hypothetical protein
VSLHVFFQGAELSQAWLDLLDAGRIGAEIEAATQLEELGEGLLPRIQVVCAPLAKLQ